MPVTFNTGGIKVRDPNNPSTFMPLNILKGDPGDPTELINDAQASTGTTYSSEKIEEQITLLNGAINNKANKFDTVLDTTLSRGRKADTAIGDASIAFGESVEASGRWSQAFGNSSVASGGNSHAEGGGTAAIGQQSHSEGGGTVAEGTTAHAEGYYAGAVGAYSHAEGSHTVALGNCTHAEGSGVFGNVLYLTGEENATTYSYSISQTYESMLQVGCCVYLWHIISQVTSIDTVNKIITVSKSFGQACSSQRAKIIIGYASGFTSHVEGIGTIADSSYQHVQGKYNVIDSNGTYIDIVGNGQDHVNRSNAFALGFDGNGYFAGDVFIQCNPDGTGGTKLVGGVSDVQIEETSILDAQGVANLPFAVNNGAAGIIKINTGYGLETDSSGIAKVKAATATKCKNGTDTRDAIVAFYQHNSVFYGLAKAAGADMKNIASTTVGVYPEEQKSAISQMLNAPVTIPGTTPSITAKPGVRYVCGECSTLDITAPASGDIEVIFDSGSTATVLTVTPPTGVTTVKWANGFDPTSLDANTRYDLIITDGEWGLIASWAR